ncbi:hypothetical protein ABL78_0618 [Leptomonas seymouri]|uniref:Uncharacterized protein n=1 Tax=Leptomonas seymouri TaxID=5684 RepID=A0A0N0P8Q8_LEPSE|nr:hypothetical protein ABL78_0618 [Leptomonas seymouri]|eukprot:KPI90236.1 hypothetical protein ABL78_0618 [Leptomonas seymouri]
MEVGKLVTSETCGKIFYFVIDETHPDEPQPDASKCYYIVAPSSSTFSYREAYYVLCRALCGVENRTYLHRWHSLHEQIFGTSPYVQFVNAVRESPLTQPNSFCHTAHSSPQKDGHTRPSVTLPALFLDETTARLALRKAEKELQATAETDAPPRDSAPQGCSTPVSKPLPITRVDPVAVLAENGLVRKQEVAEAPQAAEVVPHREANSLEVVQQRKLDELLSMASQWQEAAAALRGDQHHAVLQLQRDLQQERMKRLEAEERCQRQAHELEEAYPPAKKQKQPGAPLTAACAAVDSMASNAAVNEDKKMILELKQRVQELEAELTAREQRHSHDRDQLIAETQSLKQQLWQQSQAQGAQLSEFLQENAGAVKRVEKALEKREKELCAVYAQALEERDIRIAQLSQEVLQHLQSSRQLAAARSDQERLQAERVTHLEEIASQLKEWNGALRLQLNGASEEILDLRQRLQNFAQRPGNSYQEQRPLARTSLHHWLESQQSCSVCAGLSRAAAVQLADHARLAQEQLLLERARAEQKTEELNRAAQVIEQLTRGVRKAKSDVDVFLHQACAARAVDPLRSIAAAQSIT